MTAPLGPRAPIRTLALLALAVLGAPPRVHAARAGQASHASPAGATSVHVPDLGRRYRGQARALARAWSARRAQLSAAGVTHGAADDHTHSLFVFPHDTGVTEPFYPERVAVDAGEMRRLGFGFGRTAFDLGDGNVIKATMRHDQSEMFEEVRKYKATVKKLGRLGPAGQYALARLGGIAGTVRVGASRLGVDLGHPLADRRYIVNEKLSAPTMEHVLHQAVEAGGFPRFSDDELLELARTFKEAGDAGVLLQGDPGDFTFSATPDPAGRRFMAIDPAGWTVFSPRTQQARALVTYLSAESFAGTFLRVLGRVPLPTRSGQPQAYEPNKYDPRNDAELEALKAQLARVTARTWGPTARPPRGIRAHFERVLASGDPRRDPYLRQMIAFELEDPQALSTALVHCGIGVVVTTRETLDRMHAQRQSARSVRSVSGQRGRQEATDLSSVGFGDHDVVEDPATGLVAVYNRYNVGNADGATIEERRPHAPWQFVELRDVATAVLRHARTTSGAPTR